MGSSKRSAPSGTKDLCSSLLEDNLDDKQLKRQKNLSNHNDNQDQKLSSPSIDISIPQHSEKEKIEEQDKDEEEEQEDVFQQVFKDYTEGEIDIEIPQNVKATEIFALAFDKMNEGFVEPAKRLFQLAREAYQKESTPLFPYERFLYEKATCSLEFGVFLGFSPYLKEAEELYLAGIEDPTNKNMELKKDYYVGMGRCLLEQLRIQQETLPVETSSSCSKEVSAFEQTLEKSNLFYQKGLDLVDEELKAEEMILYAQSLQSLANSCRNQLQLERIALDAKNKFEKAASILTSDSFPVHRAATCCLMIADEFLKNELIDKTLVKARLEEAMDLFKKGFKIDKNTLLPLNPTFVKKFAQANLSMASLFSEIEEEELLEKYSNYAIKWFQKSLQLNPEDEDVIAILQELQPSSDAFV